ncbi:GDSL esterase/lipase [Camellia lanceoleosa]|uniref:GDSL esterase/lipase n=1 Tax=Camellia lanceoleosa TaxID=1840588 RepID=A0ACC0GDK4_9ERIC|nr:GDSL esterase/lipase [Camellia lanceoleosa]
MGKLLGINYKGKEEEVLTKILDLEAKDRVRRFGLAFDSVLGAAWFATCWVCITKKSAGYNTGVQPAGCATCWVCMLLGITVRNACCVVNLARQRAPNQVPCSNRRMYAFWDGFHPTEAAHVLVAASAYNALTPLISAA